MKKRALVIFSGGQDSTTCLGYAMKHFDYVEAITFNYGQKHSIEIECAKKICEKYNIKQFTIDISFLNTIVDSALTSNGDVNQQHPRLKNLPASYVPNRNALFITLSHAYAQKIGAEILITGTCETDFSGYPDCRRVFIDSIEKSLNLGSETDLKIETPLMLKDKAQTFKLAEEVGVLEDVIELSHTCYNGNHESKHEWGYGCGECPACLLRKKGYEEFLNLYYFSL